MLSGDQSELPLASSMLVLMVMGGNIKIGAIRFSCVSPHK